MIRPETNEEPEPGSGSRRRFYPILAAILLAAFLVRIGYVAAQPETDPRFAAPAFDGEYYVDWARSLAGDTRIDAGRFAGAFYLAPLYPHLLALFLKLFGQNFALLYGFQHLLAVATAALLALGGRRPWGELPALLAAALFLLYQPLLFFASCPLGETLAILLLVAALGAMGRESVGWRGAAGLLIGLGALARPNLALVVIAWGIGELLLRRFRMTAVLGAGFLLVVLPVGFRNLAVSGHFVPISANSGMTLYHGNGPGAQGLFGPLPAGFTGNVTLQREEATRAASIAAGRQLDPVAADAHWRRGALRARRAAGWGTVRLGLRRLLLTLDDRETGLDYDPNLDANPWRRLAPLPFALLLGLAAAGLAAHGLRGRARWPVWAAILACAATPILFYVSSRYRLPMAALLAVPAAWGLTALRAARAARAATALVLVAALSWAMPLVEPGLQRLLGGDRAAALTPYADLRKGAALESLVSRGTACWRAGKLEVAEDHARRALAMSRGSARALTLLGMVLEKRERTAEAEAAYREALAVGTDARGRVAAASNLAALLIRRDQPSSALPFLRQALQDLPLHPHAWHNLLVALFNAGRTDEAAEALGRARAAGVPVDAETARAIEAAGAAREP